jgi:NAD(P)-dependent dehydrogenase (short-subunit alcohol dehydrogenase family)
MTEELVLCVAGGTSGIGRRLAEDMLAEGARVAVIGLTEGHASEFLTGNKGHGDRLMVECADLTSFETCQSVAQMISSKFGSLGLLVNAAGTISTGGVEQEVPEQWERVLRGNLSTAFNMLKATLPLLRSTPGANVVNVSSVCSLRPCASISYSVSKAGLDMFTRTAARELAPLGVRVNSVNPSVVRSNLQKSAGMFSDDESYDAWLTSMTPMHPLGRVGEPSDVVSAIRYLGSKEASWVTGAILSVDGGRGIA